jgi:uncharacterized membrane protein YgdD (TMEM256/DUF423 family)
MVDRNPIGPEAPPSWVDRSRSPIVALVVFTGGLVVSVLLGLDDLDTPIDGVLLAIGVGWLTMCWFATAERVHA